MLDWLRRYCTVDEGGAYDQPYLIELGGWRPQRWLTATDRKTLVAVRPGDGWWAPEGGYRFLLSNSNMAKALHATPTGPVVKCNLDDLLRFCGYVEREACSTCFNGNDGLYQWTQERPAHSQIGHCVDCYQSNGWITPAAPSDTRKAIVAGVSVCMSRLAWSIPPELVEPVARVRLWACSWSVSDWPRSLVIDDAAQRWRVMVAPCDITDEKVIPPTFHPDPLFAWLWQAARDDRVSMAVLSDWLEERQDAFAEVIRV